MYSNREDIKPSKLKLHDFLVRKTAVQVMIDETIVEKVISHEKKEVNNAFKIHKEVEISGFGKFTISQVKLRKKIVKVERILENLEKKLNIDSGNPDIIIKIDFAKADLIYYKSRLK